MTRARLLGARAMVDSERFRDIRSSLDLADELREFRRRVDLGAADYTAAATFFRTADVAVEIGWETAMHEVDRRADQAPRPSDLRSRMRSIRGTMPRLRPAPHRNGHTEPHFLAPPP